MKASLTLALLLVSGMALGTQADEPMPPALGEMQGTWTMLSFTVDGNDVGADVLVTWQRIVRDKHVVWKDGDRTFIELDIQIDPTKAPKTLDSTVATGEEKGQTLLAIYELKDDVLRVCFAMPGDPRPTEFSAIAGSGRGMYRCQRLSR